MEDIVLFISENYKNINQLRFDHIINKNDYDVKYFDDFIDNFLKAKTTGKEKGIYVHNYLSKSIGSRKTRFNRGSFCLKNNGDIVICNFIKKLFLKLLMEYLEDSLY